MTTVLDQVVAARSPFSTVLEAGSSITLVDLGGNQAIDCLLYNAEDHAERYCAHTTIAAQRNLFLTTGSVLRSNESRPMLTVTDDTCGRHDTIGGACSQESNTLRYGFHTKHQHACVDNFLTEGSLHGLDKRDLVSNVNWFMNVPVEEDGTLGIVDGLSAPGISVSGRAEMPLLVLISNCPQINNPCNGFDPTPIRVVVERP
ncbi:MAG: urea amidolyase associated protein UAAP2 [Acidimicrobiales bacterium]